MREISKRIREICESKGFKKILIQIPEGLRIYVDEICNELSNFDVFISLDPCYGACDVKRDFDATFHIAHTKIFECENVFFIDYFQEVRSLNNLLKFLDELPKNIGIVTTAQFGYFMNELKSILEKSGKVVHIAKGKYSKFPGQIFGCYFEPARIVEKNVDCFLFFGTGKFHAIGLGLITNKPIYCFDPILDKFFTIKNDVERYIRRRLIEISRAKNTDMKRIGIIISSKPGQKRIGTALKLKEEIKRIGAKPFFLYMDDISPDKLVGLNFDFYINTACPRLVDDYEKFKEFIILNPNEFYMLIGKIDKYYFEDYF